MNRFVPLAAVGPVPQLTRERQQEVSVDAATLIELCLDLERVEELHSMVNSKATLTAERSSVRSLLKMIRQAFKNDIEASLDGYEGREVCRLPDDMYISTKNG